MKTLAISLLFAIAVANAANTPPKPPLGCSPKSQERGAFRCSRDFYVAFQKKPGSTCDDNFDGYLRCLARNNLKCMPGGPIGKPTVDQFVQMMKGNPTTVAMKQTLCDFTIMNGGTPGDNCNEAGRKATMQCVQRFRAKFLKNRGDPGLCRAYTRATKCSLAARKRNKCKVTKEEKREALKDNLFCAPKED